MCVEYLVCIYKRIMYTWHYMMSGKAKIRNDNNEKVEL